MQPHKPDYVMRSQKMRRFARQVSVKRQSLKLISLSHRQYFTSGLDQLHHIRVARRAILSESFEKSYVVIFPEWQRYCTMLKVLRWL